MIDRVIKSDQRRRAWIISLIIQQMPSGHLCHSLRIQLRCTSSAIHTMVDIRARMKGVILVSHYGADHDCNQIFREMISHGVHIPPVRVVDSVLTLKMVINKQEPLSLGRLEKVNFPSVKFKYHHARRDALMLMKILVLRKPWRQELFYFSCPSDHYIKLSLSSEVPCNLLDDSDLICQKALLAKEKDA